MRQTVEITYARSDDGDDDDDIQWQRLYKENDEKDDDDKDDDGDNDCKTRITTMIEMTMAIISKLSIMLVYSLWTY